MNRTTKFILMGSKKWYCFIWLIFSLFFCCSFVHSLNNSVGDSLDALLQDCAFKALARRRPHTGALCKASLPANLSGMEVSVVRLRSRSFWSRGANFSNFHIPSRTMPIPYVRRLAIVYQDLGNWSSYYYNVPGYSLVGSVVGFMVYDASNLSAKSNMKLDLNTMAKPISIQFPNLTFFKGMIPRPKCAAFSGSGTVYLSDVKLPNVCYSQNQGHFSIVVPLKSKQKLWDEWVIGFVLGFVGLVLVGVGGMLLVGLLKMKKIQKMEREADEGVFLDTIWIGNSKMPFVTIMRTQPVLESGGFL